MAELSIGFSRVEIGTVLTFEPVTGRVVSIDLQETTRNFQVFEMG